MTDTSDEIDALQRAITTEQQAIFGHGLAGGHLAGTERDAARDALAVHEIRRDVLVRLLRDRNQTPTSPPPAYHPSHPVTGRRSALRLLVALEDGCTSAHAGIVGAARRRSLRRSGLGWLTDAAVRAQLWRAEIGPTASTKMPALPGLKPPATSGDTPSPAPSPTSPAP